MWTAAGGLTPSCLLALKDDRLLTFPAESLRLVWALTGRSVFVVRVFSLRFMALAQVSEYLSAKMFTGDTGVDGFHQYPVTHPTTNSGCFPNPQEVHGAGS